MWHMAGVDEADKLDRKKAAKVMRRSVGLLGPYKRQTAGAVLLITFWTFTILAGPFFVKYGIDQGIVKHDGGVLDRAVVGYIAVAVIAYFVYRAQIMLVGKIGEGFLRDLRVRVFDHLQQLSMPFYDREKAGVIVSRMTSDVDALAELVQTGLLMFLANGLLLVFSVVVLAIVSWKLFLVCLITLPFVIISSIKFQRDSNKAYLLVRDRIGTTLSSLQEGLSGVRVIQAYGREDEQVRRFTSTSRELYEAHMDSVRISAWYLPIIEFSGVFTTAIAVGVGGVLVANGSVTIGTVTFFLLTLSNLFEPVQQLSQLFNTVQSAGAGLNKLYELLDTPADVPERPGAVELPHAGAVDVKDVSFRYAAEGGWVLHDVSLHISPGERLALVGPTGAGKSTLAKLIARLYDPVQGRVEFGNIDVSNATLRSLRSRICVVPQEGFLFNGTIRDNVRIAKQGASDDEVDDALRAIAVYDRFSELPNGLETEVRERGSRLSAGEKQLVSLARAALADPSVLVLDEATSSLDPGTELLVEDALERLMEGRTVVVIAHRLSTAERADRIGVVDAGGLVELGTHDDLVAAGGQYAALYSTWAGRMTAASAS
jgi:ATP-binding cassette subfamily B protein